MTSKQRKKLKTYPTAIRSIILEGEAARKRIRAEDPEPIHSWFELSYADYVALPRSVLQTMPRDWQAKFVALMDKLDEMIDWRQSNVRVTRIDDKGKKLYDRFVGYERGRRRVPFKMGALNVPRYANTAARVKFLKEHGWQWDTTEMSFAEYMAAVERIQFGK